MWFQVALGGFRGLRESHIKGQNKFKSYLIQNFVYFICQQNLCVAYSRKPWQTKISSQFHIMWRAWAQGASESHKSRIGIEGSGGPSLSAAMTQFGNGVFGRVFIKISSETWQQLRPIGHSTRTTVDRLLGTHPNEEIYEKDEKSANKKKIKEKTFHKTRRRRRRRRNSCCAHTQPPTAEHRGRFTRFASEAILTQIIIM